MKNKSPNFVQIESSISKCVACKKILSKYGVTPKPIFSGELESPIMLLGQAPGITEYKTGKPFQGRAGQSIKNLFSKVGVLEFDRFIYQTSITKCFPGRKANTSVDRQPSKVEIDNCNTFLIQQIKIINPKIIVCLGMLAWKALILLKETNEPGFCQKNYSKPISKLTTGDIVGKLFEYKGISIIAMIHPSGAANGARVKNKENHEKSILLLENKIKNLSTEMIVNLK